MGAFGIKLSRLRPIFSRRSPKSWRPHWPPGSGESVSASRMGAEGWNRIARNRSTSYPANSDKRRGHADICMTIFGHMMTLRRHAARQRAVYWLRSAFRAVCLLYRTK
jgi:hypothetical protein